MSELETKFMSLYKNRLLLCNEEGKLKKENTRYEKNYKALFEEVGKMFAKELSLSFPLEVCNSPRECEEMLRNLFSAYAPEVVDILMKGTYTDLLKLRRTYINNAYPSYKAYLKEGVLK